MPQLSMLCSCSTCSCTCSRFITGRLINFWNTNRTVTANKQGKTMQLLLVNAYGYSICTHKASSRRYATTAAIFKSHYDYFYKGYIVQKMLLKSYWRHSGTAWFVYLNNNESHISNIKWQINTIDKEFMMFGK